ncbi:metallophosphoesterase family protein [uncultured Dialister sp.]|uniref:purple acid phosphatase family protein n=1 Tax=uncultured Dialister sp. TaxID=278064 RepID=UPI0025E22954|nr:metallophosphoesterase family protein [uncultured Dialister sp.]
MNKKWTALALVLGLAAGMAGCGNPAAPSSRQAASGPVTETMKPFNVHQVVAADNEKGRTVMWEMPESKENSLEYRKKGTDTIYTVPASGKALTGNRGIKNGMVYTAELTNLEKGTAYEYRTREENRVSSWYPLATDDGGAFKVIVTSDSQSSDYSDWKNLIRHAADDHQDAAFMIALGDLVDNGDDEYQWQTWFDSTKDILSRIPVAPALGNHEAYSLDWKEHMPDRYLTHFNLPDNGNRDFKNHYYSFDWGDVHFTVLDTSLNEEKEWMPDLYEKEKVWLEKDLRETKKKWKVVLMHKDPLQYGFADESRPHREEGFSEEGQYFMPVFDKYGVDLVLSAHLHTYRDRGHIYDFKRSDKGPVYVIDGLSGNVRYPGLWKKHELDEYVAPQPETDNYSILEASEDKLVLIGYLPDGTKLHETVVRKG